MFGPVLSFGTLLLLVSLFTDVWLCERSHSRLTCCSHSLRSHRSTCSSLNFAFMYSIWCAFCALIINADTFSSIIYRYVFHLMFRPSLVVFFHCILFVLAYSESLACYKQQVILHFVASLPRLYVWAYCRCLLFYSVCLSLCCLFPTTHTTHNTLHTSLTDIIRLIRLFARGQHLLCIIFHVIASSFHSPIMLRISHSVCLTFIRLQCLVIVDIFELQDYFLWVESSVHCVFL